MTPLSLENVNPANMLANLFRLTSPGLHFHVILATHPHHLNSHNKKFKIMEIS